MAESDQIAVAYSRQEGGGPGGHSALVLSNPDRGALMTYVECTQQLDGALQWFSSTSERTMITAESGDSIGGSRANKGEHTADGNEICATRNPTGQTKGINSR